MISQIIFIILLIISIYFFIRNANIIRNNILRGRKFKAIGGVKERFMQMMLIAFGQKKMFKRPVPAVLHLFVYLGFLLVNVELIEIIFDGVFGTHRAFKPYLGDAFYNFLINFFEFFAIIVVFVCVLFLVRRNLFKVKRFSGNEMTRWSKLDANLILFAEIVLMFFLLNMNATDTAIKIKEGVQNVPFYKVSAFFVPFYKNASIESIYLAERFYWWAHIIGVFVFANYVLFSKHLHIFLAFPNTFLTDIKPKGKISNMPTVANEVKLMLDPNAIVEEVEEVATFGAKDVIDLSRKSLLEAYSCTECGRCTDNCPANITGKKLSPRKIMMDTRDRVEEVGKGKRKEGEGFDDGKSLIDDYITEEELLACTSCNACVEACPVNINPLNIIIELRRYKAMEETKQPAEWNGMYQNIETSLNPWKFPPSDRAKWINEV